MTTELDWATSPAAIRTELVRRMTADLCGPMSGEDEILRGFQRDDGTWTSAGRVNDFYLVGKLAPAGTVSRDPERSDDPGTSDNDPEQGSYDGPIAQRVLAQSSFGITVVVPSNTKTLIATCRWGAYTREDEPHDDGTNARVWQRRQFNEIVMIPIQEGSIGPLPVDGKVVLRGQAISTAEGDRLLVTVFLSNEQDPVLENIDTRWLFQAGFDLSAPNDEAVFCGREKLHIASVMPENERQEAAQLDMAYRQNVELGVGHGVGVNWEREPDSQRGTRVGTSVIPQYEVGRTRAPNASTTPELAGLITDMKALAELSADELTDALMPLSEGYRSWLHVEVERADNLDPHREAAEVAVAEAKQVADAIQAGIELLSHDLDVLDAFRFANLAMSRQRVHTVAIGYRRSDPKLTLEESLDAADLAENRSWHPFQLAFILLCLPSLSDPSHPERCGSRALADLLFFPTGGGKTEAYLGLVAYTLAIRRLQGVVGDGEDRVNGRDGVAVIMRYTLRLLTAQQFQRAATLICAAELLRQNRAASDSRFDGVPFRLGMWVGSSVTPNSDKDAKRWADAQRRQASSPSGTSTPLQFTECPWCGFPIDSRQDCYFDDLVQRFFVFCGDPHCPFNQGASDEGIPVLTVDSQIYRLLPSFVIGTIDKFAQLPWNGALSTLFGRVERRCERHGYRNPDLDRSHQNDWRESDTHLGKGHLPKASTVDVLRLRPPDLILQDEMHLVTGPLGTMAGLYEATIDRLATWTYKGNSVRPKVVASTATVRRAHQQAKALFCRDLRVFPPSVLDASHSFFSEQIIPSEDDPGRFYLGICAHGERLKQVGFRVYAALMAAAQGMYEELGENGSRMDPWMSVVGYFNAVRELAGMRRIADDQLRSRLRRNQVTPGLESRTQIVLEELTSRVSSDDIRKILRRLFVSHDPVRGDEEYGERPLDLLLATNMVSVGVDVPRLGAMVVMGQPKTTAEYIQATSRVGRSEEGPGLVIVIYNWARPRDLSHYETFGHYHATFARFVEPLSVTPFAERALDKGLTATLVGAIRHHDPDWNPNNRARSLDFDDPRIADHVSALATRAKTIAGVEAQELVREMTQQRLDEWEKEKRLRPSLSYDSRGQDNVPLLDRPESGDWTVWTCPRSLRNTEALINMQIFSEDPTYRSESQPIIILGQEEPQTNLARTLTAEDEDPEDSLDVDPSEQSQTEVEE